MPAWCARAVRTRTSHARVRGTSVPMLRRLTCHYHQDETTRCHLAQNARPLPCLLLVQKQPCHKSWYPQTSRVASPLRQQTWFLGVNTCSHDVHTCDSSFTLSLALAVQSVLTISILQHFNLRVSNPRAVAYLYFRKFKSPRAPLFQIEPPKTGRADSTLRRHGHRRPCPHDTNAYHTIILHDIT